MNRQHIYSAITDKIVSKLKEGTVPWRKSWIQGLPSNYITKHVYKGINFISLCFDNYPSPYYLTYLQCKERNGFIKKGEHASPIIYWKIIEKFYGEEETKRIPFMRLSNVFNLSQTSLYSEDIPNNGIKSCEEIINNMKNKPEIRNNFSSCYYNVRDDYISLPKISDFDSREEYYSTLFHELAHSTGSPKRLNRFTNKDDDSSYAEEELIAELTSSFLCGLSGISNATINNSAAYLGYWINALESDTNYIQRITSKANQIVDYIINVENKPIST